jgi:hypothetical protein
MEDPFLKDYNIGGIWKKNEKLFCRVLCPHSTKCNVESGAGGRQHPTQKSI